MQTEEKTLTGYPSVDKPWMKYYDEKLIDENIPQMNIFDYMKSNTEAYSDNTAISYFGKKITYKELYQNVESVMKILAGIGVKNNDRIMYMMPNIPETAYFMYATTQLGAVADFVDPRPDSVDLQVSAEKIFSLVVREKINYIVALELCYLGMIKPIEQKLAEAGVSTVIVVSASASMDGKAKLNYIKEILSFKGLGAVKEQLNKNKRTQSLMAEAYESSKLTLVNYEEALEKFRDVETRPVAYEQDKLNIIVHTSGTTSAKPKPIPLTNDNLNAYVHQTFAANMPMSEGDKALHMLPYFAAFGVVDVAHAGLCHGNNLIQVPEFSIENLGRLIVKYKPQIVIGAPTWFLSMLKDKTYNKKDLSFISMITYGGDSMEIADELRINDFLETHNCREKLTKGHGMSETCGCASYAIGEYNVPGTVGIPMPYTKYALIDPDTKELLKFEEGQEEITGELIISSPVVTGGILDGEVIVPRCMYDGESYIYTRDIAKMNRDGIMTFLSRSDRSFTRYDGFKVKVHEVENVIKGIDNVRYCVVSAYFCEEKLGNMILANIVLENEETDMEAAKRIITEGFINNPNVSTRQIPSKIRFRKSLPVTANGKIDFKKVTDEGLCGDEITVELEETNLFVGEIKIYK